jgi:putative phosphoserine phosphatase/1-acylglycerol-3-phosphate O-acyltransferase
MQKKLVKIYRICLGFLLITIMGVVALSLRIVSLGRLTNFNRKYLVPVFSKFILLCIGIRVDNRLKLEEPERPHFYTFNHNSYLDAFILMCLGLTNTRFLMSEKMLYYLPVTLVALSIGLLYIPTKENRERRLKFFIDLAERIKRERVSIAGSSEGAVGKFNTISEFNRGVYHMALVCGMPIVAIFIHTPVESNPYHDFRPIKSGTVRMELIGIIPTARWKLENLDTHIEEVRRMYVEKFNSCSEVKIT